MEMRYVWQHLNLVCISAIFTTLIGLVLGILSYRFKQVRPLILWLVDLMQTIPVLALLGVIMLFFGGTATTVIIGIVLYSLLPVVRNTYVGLEGINPAIKEAANGMGMTNMQRLFKVELPLSFPIIFTGIRIGVVTSIGIAVFGAVVGGGGLGSTINRSILIQDRLMLLKATGVLMLMALAFDFIMSYVENKLKTRRV